MVEVDLNHIYKKYEGNDKYSVNDFDLHIKDKEFIVFVGPSGCGKSTTLRMVAGLEDISKGTLEIDHKVMNDVAPKDRDIAMVFQNYALYPHMSIYDNMAFGLKLRHYKKDEIDKRVKHAADILGLSEYLDKEPAELSGGQRQRVALARALIIEPKLLLLDEPLSNLDAKLRVAMRIEIKRIQQQLGITTVFVTHDQEECFSISDKVAIMNNGVIEQYDSPETIYRLPRTKFVAEFIGFENFFSVEKMEAGHYRTQTNYRTFSEGHFLREGEPRLYFERAGQIRKNAAGGKLCSGFAVRKGRSDCLRGMPFMPAGRREKPAGYHLCHP